MMHFRNCLVLIGLSLIAYIAAFSNGFVGDDNLLIANNSFYSSWKNVPRLFNKDYNYDWKKDGSKDGDWGTGSVSYRPFDNLTYFVDYSIWKLNPFGYHLTNVLIHVGNVLLVYFLLIRFQLAYGLALFIALLFGLHPIQVEAINNIGYRADSLAALLVFCSFYCWINYRERGRLSDYFGVLTCYFLAIFSKESALLLPALFIAYDQLIVKNPSKPKFYYLAYMGLACIAGFYLYIYIEVFPNSALATNTLLGNNFAEHFMSLQKIFIEYMLAFFWPVKIDLIPSIYFPTPDLTPTGILLSSFIILSFTMLILMYARKHKVLYFFIAWFLIFYLPISNLIPLANPMAYRFMYLPSLGIIVILGFMLHDVATSAFLKNITAQASFMIKSAVLGGYLVLTMLLVPLWGHDYKIASMWVENYPQAWKGYQILGMLYLKKGDFKSAKHYLLQALQKGGASNDVRIKYFLGMAYFGNNELIAAEEMIKDLLKEDSDYVNAHYLLADIYIKQKKDDLAKTQLLRALELAEDDVRLYHPLLRIYIVAGDTSEADLLLKKAKAKLQTQDFLLLEQRMRSM